MPLLWSWDWTQHASFQLLQVDKFRRLYSGLVANADQFRRLEEAPRVGQRSPPGEMHNPVRVVLLSEHLIRPFARRVAQARRPVEDQLPGGVVGDFVEDEDVRHLVKVVTQA